MRNKRFDISSLCMLALAACLMLVAADGMAQKYVVYSVVGKAYVQRGGKYEPLSARKYITSKSRLKITDESAVTIIDEAKQKMFSFTRTGENTVESLVALSANRIKNLTKQYMNYLVKQLFAGGRKKMIHPNAYMQVTGTSYRSGAADSLMATRIVRIAAEGTSPTGTTEQQLFNLSNLIISDLDVRLELVDMNTGRALESTVSPNTACYVRIKNNTDEILYVNVLNIDSLGNKYMVLPMDEDATCANLLVPANATVGFKADPFITSDSPSIDTFVLIATESPVNFSILMNRIKPGQVGGTPIKVGVARAKLKTKP